MTKIYYVRHAQPNYDNHDDASRELTEKGLADRKLVTAFLKGKQVDAVLSSPFRRAVQTVEDFAETEKLPIVLVPGFRERRVDSGWIEDFEGFCRRQWADFDYCLSDGETLRQVQTRNIRALEDVLAEYAGKTLVIGGHGTALCTILHYYDPSFGYEGFQKMRRKMPWMVEFTFEGSCCTKIRFFDLLDPLK